jgi:SAM-dependent methyltransferase
MVDQSLPEDWQWAGKRVLDFGAGSGRTLRHFLREAQHAQFEGCDIDAAAIEWLNMNLKPPVTGFVNAEEPPLPRPSDTYDVVYAFSVFTHITDRWADWLLELHRVLRPGGWLIASFLGEGMSRAVAGETWDANRIGMNVLYAHQDWDAGGPSVLMSPWWLREHWGRAFDIVSLDEGATEGTHGLIVARPRPGSFTAEELRRIDPCDERGIEALRHNLTQVQREAATAAEQHRQTIQSFEQSRSWRVTAPLRWRPRRRS